MERHLERSKEDPSYSPLKDPLVEHMKEQKEWIENGFRHKSVDVMFPGFSERFKLTPEQETIRKYKKEAYYE